MSTRAYVARINRDDTGLYVYLGHNGYPQTAGQSGPMGEPACPTKPATEWPSSSPRIHRFFRFRGMPPWFGRNIGINVSPLVMSDSRLP